MRGFLAFSRIFSELFVTLAHLKSCRLQRCQVIIQNITVTEKLTILKDKIEIKDGWCVGGCEESLK